MASIMLQVKNGAQQIRKTPKRRREEKLRLDVDEKSRSKLLHGKP